MFIWFGHVLPVLCLGNSYEMYASKQSQPTRSQERVVRPGLPYPMGSRKACFIEGERLPWRCAFSLCCPRPMFETKQFCDSATHPKISSQTRAPSQTPISGLGFKHIHDANHAPQPARTLLLTMRQLSSNKMRLAIQDAALCVCLVVYGAALVSESLSVASTCKGVSAACLPFSILFLGGRYEGKQF